MKFHCCFKSQINPDFSSGHVCCLIAPFWGSAVTLKSQLNGYRKRIVWATVTSEKNDKQAAWAVAITRFLPARSSPQASSSDERRRRRKMAALYNFFPLLAATAHTISWLYPLRYLFRVACHRPCKWLPVHIKKLVANARTCVKC